jgi:Na+-driven multidrug efflux pump
MYYHEKRVIASIISNALVLIAYFIYVLHINQAGRIDLEHDLQFWAKTILIFIGISIVIGIVIQILFHILNSIVNQVRQEDQDEPMVEDEMDKLIRLKAMRNAYCLVGAGVVISIITLAVQQPPVIMLNIIYLSFHIGTLFEGFSQLYYYKKGVRNG